MPAITIAAAILELQVPHRNHHTPDKITEMAIAWWGYHFGEPGAKVRFTFLNTDTNPNAHGIYTSRVRITTPAT